jgi:[ribosomal protein S5]-alanine N-acetyltransferase
MSAREPTCFIEGEKVDLHALTEEDIPLWASWFNDPSITRLLPQGLYPNTTLDQRRFIEEATRSNRFIALVKTQAGKLLGVVSLSDIDHRKRSAQTALVIPVKDETARFAALEAMCLVTQHAFEQLDVDRVWGGQVYPDNVRWSQAMELIGFVTEGIHRSAGRAERDSYDSLTFALTYEEFVRIAARREGRLWPGEEFMGSMMKALVDREPYACRANAALTDMRHQQQQWLADLDATHFHGRAE